jgi:hypothetical protein
VDRLAVISECYQCPKFGVYDHYDVPYCTGFSGTDSPAYRKLPAYTFSMMGKRGKIPTWCPLPPAPKRKKK